MPVKKKKRRNPPPLDRLERVTDDQLRAKLKSTLTLAELAALQKQITRHEEEEVIKAAENEAMTVMAATLLVLHDRFGFGSKRKARFFSAAMDYIHDIDAGVLKLKDITDALEHQDKVKLTWKIQFSEK